jgi:hypothetical protein
MAVVNCVEAQPEKDTEDIMHKKYRMFVDTCARTHRQKLATTSQLLSTSKCLEKCKNNKK